MSDENPPVAQVPPAAPPPVESPPDPLLAQLKAEVESLRVSRLDSLKKFIGVKFNLPEAVLTRLKGDNEAELEADAKALQPLFVKPAAVTPPPAPVSGQPAAENPDEAKRTFYEMRLKRGMDYSSL